jgi:hypothetical protein
MTGVLVSPAGPVGKAARWAAANAAVLFVTEAGVDVRHGVAVYPAADAFGWGGGLVATCPETLRVMSALPRRGPRALWLETADGLAVGWDFRELRAALAAVAVSFADAETASAFRQTWGLPADVRP